MIRSIGRKILGVLVVCFVSTVVCGMPANAVRNDLSLLWSKSNRLINPVKELKYNNMDITPSSLFAEMDGLTNLTFPLSILQNELRGEDIVPESTKAQNISYRAPQKLKSAQVQGRAHSRPSGQRGTKVQGKILQKQNPPKAATIKGKAGQSTEVTTDTSQPGSRKMITSTGTSGNWSDAATWIGNKIPGAEDDVMIASGTAVILNDGNAEVSSMTINGILNIVGPFTLKVTGNWINRGTFNSGTRGTVEFAGDTNALLAGTSSTAFNTLVINKGNSISTLLEITGPVNLAQGGKLILVNGLVKINRGGSLSVNQRTRLEIPSSAGIHLNGGFFASDNFSIYNQGLFRVSQGTALLGEAEGRSLETGPGGIFQMEGGSMSTIGNLVIADGTANLSGGTITISTDGKAISSLAGFDVSAGANLNITGGIVVINQPFVSGLSHEDIHIADGGNKSITGGTFKMGSADTPAGRNFRVNSRLPFYNFSVDGFQSIVTLKDDLTVNNQLTLNGQLMLNGKNLIVGSSAPAIKGILGEKAGMIVAGSGEVRKLMDSKGSFTFPLGDVSGRGDYSPVTLTFTDGTFADGAYAVVKVFNSKHPQDATTTNYLKRYWTVNTVNVTDPVFDIKATYQAADVVGTESKLTFARYDGTQWVKDGSISAIGNSISVKGVRDLSQGFSSIVSDPPVVTTVSPTIPQKGGALIADEPAPRLKSAMGIMASPATFTASGSFLVPPGVFRILVECWGGGGGGGGCQKSSSVTSGSGGGGGAYNANTLTVIPTESYTVTVGASGSVVINGNGGNGGTTTVTGPGGTVSANGGTGGASNNGAIGTGGTGGIYNGGNGGLATSNGAGGGGGAGNTGNGQPGSNTAAGAGGSGSIPGGIGGSVQLGDLAGNIGIAPGGGGGGAHQFGNTNSKAGGIGAKGYVVISYPCTNSLTSVAGTDNQIICINTILTSITYQLSGDGITGASLSGQPAGVTGSFNSTNGIYTISGTPSASGIFNYTVTPTGACIGTTTTGTILVNPLPAIGLTVGGAGAICSGTGTNITVAGSVIGTSYQLRDAGNVNVGS
ncbi:MAG TPA: hypothetical protein DCL77_12595, partial [Prolixibacteraceae bacterium]|nr:hypothetical protein [Prolixibacteraceae bacterium]